MYSDHLKSFQVHQNERRKEIGYREERIPSAFYYSGLSSAWQVGNFCRTGL